MKRELVSTLAVLSLIICGCVKRTEQKPGLSDLKHLLTQHQIAEMTRKHSRVEPAESEAQQPATVAWADLEKVNRGMIREDVLKILGKPVLHATNFKTQPTCEILYYHLSCNASSEALKGDDQVSPRKRLVPVIILDGKVAGHGWTFHDVYRQEHLDVWEAEWDLAIELASRGRPATKD